MQRIQQELVRHFQLVDTVLAQRLRELVPRRNHELQTVLDLFSNFSATSVVGEDGHTVRLAEFVRTQSTQEVEDIVCGSVWEAVDHRLRWTAEDVRGQTIGRKAIDIGLRWVVHGGIHVADVARH